MYRLAMTTETLETPAETEPHDHGDGEHTHEHQPGVSPQPTPTAWGISPTVLADYTPAVVITLQTLVGTSVYFLPVDHALEMAEKLAAQAMRGRVLAAQAQAEATAEPDASQE